MGCRPKRPFAEWITASMTGEGQDAGICRSVSSPLGGPPPGEIICVDGKAERGTVLANGRNPDIVSAYSFNTGITLATEACQEKSNEIKAVPQLIDKLDIAGKIVTADAMAMQKDIIDRIRGKGADFSH